MSDDSTPMMRQYRQIRATLPEGVILFFRLGDFYEMFFDDARTAAPILDIALTRRNGVPMCGVPFHAADNYVARLLRAGRKVAICDQMEDSGATKGIVRRDVTRIVTPGTASEEGILESNRHNFLAAVCRTAGRMGWAILDLSTGLFEGEELASLDALRDTLARTSPKECLLPAALADDPALSAVFKAVPSVSVCRGDDWSFEYETARDTLNRHFRVLSLAGFGCEDRTALVGAAGAILHYVKEDLRRQVGHIRALRVRAGSEYLVLDEATCANLDLVPNRGKDASVTVLGVLDVTKTPMGGRVLREWLLRPLGRLDAIVRRQEAVAAFCKDRLVLRDLAETLAGVRDVERLIARLCGGGGNARDLAAIAESLDCVPGLRLLVEQPESSVLLRELAGRLTSLPDMVALIRKAIADEPPVAVKEGGMVRAGYDADLDLLRAAATEGREWLARYQTSEQERTGIKTLKVRHNRVFGYYIEVSKGQADHVPASYMRKQTLVNGERFTTPELKEYENRIVGALDKSVALEYEIFCRLRDAVVTETDRIQATAEAIAEVDALASLADRALALNYSRPRIEDGDILEIRGGRHPVVERISAAERFVPNDTLLDNRNNQLLIVTGPNMAGKSTYIRQVALIVILSQMGSFVPAESARVGIADRVFTRVGASDDLARGRSTFMVEMQETAYILNAATPRSLVVLDEIGRGTSTFDGISIAWAVAEYLHNSAEVKARTLFATHYHELTDLALTMKGVKNYSILVREQGDSVVFLRRIVPGAADKSYGIQVARLAGLPSEVIDRAKEILANLEEGEFGETGQPRLARRRIRKGRDLPGQLSLFGG
jgi:DNA mismatch repair protein MutS